MVRLATVPGWADAPQDRRKFDRNAVELPRYADIEARFKGEAQGLVDRFTAGEIDERALVRGFDKALEQAELDAFVAGRRAGGTATATVSPAEGGMLARRHGRQMDFFRGFVGDMKAGRGRMDYSRRAGLYADSLWSVYSRGESVNWDEAGFANARWHWVLDPEAEHCRDCLQRAKTSRDRNGLTWDELVELGWPGENTICRTSCRCSVHQERKRALLPERMEALRPAPTPERGIEEFVQLLGGPTLPVAIPAAGIPMATVAPTVLETVAPQAARLLPVLPLALTKPDAVLSPAPGLRRYLGLGLDALLGRDENGRWFVLAIALDRLSKEAA